MPHAPSVIALDDPKAMDTLLSKAFFRPWLQSGLYLRKQDPVIRDLSQVGRKVCHYAICFGRTLILIDVHQGVFDSHDDLALEWSRFRKMALPNSRKRLAQLEGWIEHQEPLYWDAACTERLFIEPEHIYKICITAAFEKIGRSHAAILHSYGSDFYQQSFVQDEEPNPLLAYSLGDFSAVVSQLASFPDFLMFLSRHHRTVVNNDVVYASELELLDQHIVSGQPFLQAWALEKKWLSEGLKQYRSLLLQEALSAPAEVFAKLPSQASIWQQMIMRYAWHAVDSDAETKPDLLALLDILADESMMSQALLSEAMVNQAAMGAAREDEGYVAHLRSSTHAARHYVLFFYAQSEGHRYSRDQMLPHLSSLAEQVNAQQQDQLLDDVLVIGIRSALGRFESADIAHLVGYKTEPERVRAIKKGSAEMRVNRGAARFGEVARTGLCPCRSGRRFKHCCGRTG